jgi:hypothetical protein
VLTTQELSMAKAFSDYYLPNKIVENEYDDSSMSIQHLYDVLDDATDLLTLIDAKINLEDWVEFKIARARQDIADVKSYIKNNPNIDLNKKRASATKDKSSPTEKLADMFDLPIEKIIEHGTNQLALKNAVLNTKLTGTLRNSALVKLHDDEMLKEVALTCEVKNFRNLATKKIESKEILKELAKKGRGGVRYQAITKIDDQEILKDAAMNDPFEAIKLLAVQGLKNEDKIKEVFLKIQDLEHKEILLQKIKDPKFLKNVALNKNEHNILRSTAIDNIKDENILFGVAKDEESSMLLKEKAIFKIKNQDNLKELFELHDLEWKIRELIVQKISDKSFVKEVAKKEKELDPDVRAWAVKKITDKKFLNNLLPAEAEDVVRNAIKHRIEELS